MGGRANPIASGAPRVLNAVYGQVSARQGQRPEVLTKVARLDLFRLSGNQGYVVDIQSNHVSGKTRTRVIVPLIPLDALGEPITGINPVVRVDGHGAPFTYGLDL